MNTALTRQLDAMHRAGDWSGMVQAVADHFRVPVPEEIQLRIAAYKWRWVCLHCKNFLYCYYAAGNESVSSAPHGQYAIIG